MGRYEYPLVPENTIKIAPLWLPRLRTSPFTLRERRPVLGHLLGLDYLCGASMRPLFGHVIQHETTARDVRVAHEVTRANKATRRPAAHQHAAAREAGR